LKVALLHVLLEGGGNGPAAILERSRRRFSLPTALPAVTQQSTNAICDRYITPIQRYERFVGSPQAQHGSGTGPEEKCLVLFSADAGFAKHRLWPAFLSGARLLVDGPLALFDGLFGCVNVLP